MLFKKYIVIYCLGNQVACVNGISLVHVKVGRLCGAMQVYAYACCLSVFAWVLVREYMCM